MYTKFKKSYIFDRNNQLKVNKMKLKNKTNGDLFTQPDQIIEAYNDYCMHLEANPIKEERPMKNGTMAIVNHVRPRTWQGFAVFLGVSTLRYYRTERKDFFDVCQLIDSDIKDTQYSYAATGLYKENIVSSWLGLRTIVINENREVNRYAEMTEEELNKEIAKRHKMESVRKDFRKDE